MGESEELIKRALRFFQFQNTLDPINILYPFRT